MKLSLKLVLQCALTGIIPVAVSFFLTQHSTESTMARHGESFLAAAGFQADKVDRNLFERYSDVQVFATTAAVRDQRNWYKPGDEANPLTARMNELMQAYGMYDLAVVVDLDGKVVATTTRDAHGKPVPVASLATRSFKDASWFRAVASEQYTTESKRATKEHHGANGTYVELALDSPELRAVSQGATTRALTFSAPVKKDGKTIGYWTNWMNLTQIDGMMAATGEEMGVAGVQVALLDAAGNVVSQHGFGEVKVTGLGLTEAIAGTHKAWTAVDEAGEKQILAVHPTEGALDFPGLGWAILVRAPASLAAAATLADARTALGVQLGLLVLILAVSVGFGWLVSKPIVQMANAADKIAQGDLEVEITHKSSDEIGRLAESFRSMLGYLGDVSHAADAVSRGDLSVELVKRSEKDSLGESVSRVVTEVKKLVSEVGGLSSVATMGRVDGRLQVDQFEGAYQDVARGVNQMLDAMLAPIHEGTQVLERMAARDFTANMVGDYRGDHVRLKNAVNLAVSNVRGGLLQVARGAEQVKAAASQIASGSQSLASGASTQAAALTETRTTLEGVANMTERNAAHAERATMLASEAQDLSRTGASSMGQLAEAVGRIRSAVMNTAEIIRDINQIAFQTNLLALNAAVEAARAGDAGRGFAVVADEVRNLAQQAKGAAHKTEELLRGAISQAEQGEQISKEVSHGLSEIVSAVESVDSIIKEIASASREQALGVHQVTQATGQMDQVTHQNAASSEELSSTAEELSAQALELTAMVGHFRLEDSGAAPRSAAPRAPRAPAPRAESSAELMIPPQQLIPFDDQLELRDF